MEEREFGGEIQVYYVLDLESGHGAKLMLPVDKVRRAGVRDLVSATKARALMKSIGEEATLAAEVGSDASSRKLRATGYSEGLRSGSADRYTAVLRELLSRFRLGKLSPTEQQTLQQALTLFVGEMSAALDRTHDDLRADLRSVTELPTARF
jgi:RNA polymerase-interacting CarD/CdnL/TRCF family regulator